MSRGEYLAGAAFLLATAGAIAGAAALIAARIGPRDRLQRFLAFTLLLTAGLTFVPLIAGALGLFRREWTLLAALALLGATYAASRRWPAPRAESPRTEDREPSTAAESRSTRVLAWTLLGVLLVAAVAHLREVALVATRLSDMTTFHLPVIARWFQADSIWGLHQFAPLRPEETYPQNGDIVMAGLMLPFESDFIVRPLGAVFLALTGVAVYTLARELGGGRAASLLMTCVLMPVPTLLLAAFEGMPDPIMLSAFTSGVLFLLRQARTGSRIDLVLAGLGLGLAFGAKWWAASTVGVIFVVWLAAHAAARRPPRVLLGNAAVLLAVISAAGGFWLVRNLVETGNPVFPLKVAPLGLTIFDAPPDPGRDAFGSTLVDYVGDGEVWREQLLPDFNKTMGVAALFLAGCGALAGGLALRKRRGAAAQLAFAVAAGLIAVVYVNTPYSAMGPEGEPVLAAINGRWTMGALILCVALAAWLHGRLPRAAAIVVEVIAVFAFLGGINYGIAAGPSSVLIAMLVVAPLAAAALWARRRSGGTPAIAGAAVAGAFLLVAVGDEAQRRFHDRRYADVDPVLTYIREKAPEGNKIGIAGEVEALSPVLAAFGPRFENRVEYVGPFRRHLLHFYEDDEEFVAALRRGRYDLLLVQRGVERVELGADQRRWAEADGWRQVAKSPRFTLYRPS